MNLSRNTIEQWLVEILLPKGATAAELKPVADEIRRVALGYTEKRQGTIAPLSASACRAYALYYLLINLEKIERLLKLIPAASSSQELRVLDYGSGPGTAAFALAMLRGSSFSLDAVDSNPEMLKIARQLLTKLEEIRSVSALDIFTPGLLSEQKYDLIFAAHVFNELEQHEQQKLADKLVEHLSPNGTLFIIDTALQEETRRTMELRDYLLAEHKKLFVVFPCTHQKACPMLRESKSDWCHGPLNWQTPHLVRQLDELTGFNKHRIKYSAFIFSRNPAYKIVHENHFRVVAPPTKSKIGHQLTLCGSPYYGEVLCRKRDRAEGNIEFRRADHFDKISIDHGGKIDKLLDKNYTVAKVATP